ncbi:hypothetical protein ASF43_25570 [Pseudorhodoferax sp. Leaf267]|nr:hypothetical protein ASF43_25570 [Pseudorhodoferax sp. Leaf267]
MFDLRAEQLANPVPTLLSHASAMNDAQLDEDLAASKIDGDPVDFGAFEIVTGSDQFNRACIWIRSGLRDGMHYAVPLYTTIEEQAARAAAERTSW